MTMSMPGTRPIWITGCSMSKTWTVFLSSTSVSLGIPSSSRSAPSHEREPQLSDLDHVAVLQPTARCDLPLQAELPPRKVADLVALRDPEDEDAAAGAGRQHEVAQGAGADEGAPRRADVVRAACPR